MPEAALKLAREAKSAGLLDGAFMMHTHQHDTGCETLLLLCFYGMKLLLPSPPNLCTSFITTAGGWSFQGVPWLHGPVAGMELKTKQWLSLDSQQKFRVRGMGEHKEEG